MQIETGRIKLTVNGLTRLLNTAYPRNYFLPHCNNALFDASCTLVAANFAVNGSVSAAGSATVFDTNLTQADNYFALGYIVWTSGANNGIKCFVKSYANASGQITLAYPISPPAAGDTFTAYPGCDKLQSTCSGTFNNLPHYRGFPYVPTPETLEAGPGSSPPARIGGAGGAGVGTIPRGPGGTSTRFSAL